ncbi:unnamed protein product, partial [marine sediment metagenome]
MVKVGQINIDGTKMKANAANRRTKTKDEYYKWLKKIDKRIAEMFREADKVDAYEDELYGKDKRGDELPEDLNTDEKMDKKIKEVLERLKQEKKVNFTDVDAKFMKMSNGRIDAAYNCQAAVTNEQVIVESEVITLSNDRPQLEPMIEGTERNLGKRVKGVAADTGYFSYGNFEYLAKRKKKGYIPDRNEDKGKREGANQYDKSKFQYDREKDEYICPDGKRLRRVSHKNPRKNRTWHGTVYRGKKCNTCSNKALCTS